MDFNVNFFILSQYLFIFLFVFPSLCVRFLSFFFFAPFIFLPLATPTATPPPDWLLRPRPPRVAESLGIEADMRTLALYLGKWRARGKKKYFKKMNGLMNLSIPKPNWKWIETKSNESFVKTKQKNMLKKQQQHRRQQLETNFNRRIFLRNYQENYLKRKKKP